MSSEQATSRVVIVSDLKRGHVNQSRVIARMLGDTDPLVMELNENLRNGHLTELLLRLKLASRGREALTKQRAARLVQRHLKPERPGVLRQLAHEVIASNHTLKLFTVSSGTPPATFNLIMARMLEAQAIVNMTPSLLPRKWFDLCIIPAHDTRDAEGLPRNTLASPLALGYHDTAAARLLADSICNDHGLKKEGIYWGVAIGGPSSSCRWQGDRVLDELAAVHGQAKQHGVHLLVTTSRRTPQYCRTWLSKHYRQSEQVAYFLDAATNPLNPLPAMYELADRMFVTNDSFSMASEAIQAGHLPVLLATAPGPPTGKLARAYAALASAWQVVMPDPNLDLPARLEGRDTTRKPSNAEYEQLATRVRSSLGL